MVDLKRLKNHYANYEPMLKMMRGKYETAMKASPAAPTPTSTPPTSASPLRARPSSARRHVPPFHAFRRRCSSSWSATVLSHG